jgi:hypothetical protein
MAMDRRRLLEHFDEQVRRNLAPEPGFRVERTHRSVRVLGHWNCVLYADVDDATVDAEILSQKAYFGDRGFEWKVYGHDRPHDFAAHLEDAGFTPADEETLMVFDLAGEISAPTLVEDIAIRRIVDPNALQDVAAVGRRAFDVDLSAMMTEFAARMPHGTLAFYVAYRGSEPLAAGRLELPASGEFAGLYGGGTVPAARQRGLYRAVVAARADEARRRGYRYLTVEAAQTSRPILARLGFDALTWVRGWEWRGDRADDRPEGASQIGSAK